MTITKQEEERKTKDNHKTGQGKTTKDRTRQRKDKMKGKTRLKQMG
jgi:hypothetical protein